MRLLRKLLPLPCLLFACLASAQAGPPVKAPAPPSASAIPDYGGRDSAPVSVGEAAPNPLAQMGTGDRSAGDRAGRGCRGSSTR